MHVNLPEALIMSETVQLPDDPEEAKDHYLRFRRYMRQNFEGFLQHLNSQALRWLEQQFEDCGGDLNCASFLKVFLRVCPKPASSASDALSPSEQRLAIEMAMLALFEGMDVDQSGGASWMEFVEFISAVAEELRLKGEELTGTTFEFKQSKISPQISSAYRPSITKCHFDKMFYWPQHPLECVIVFEEGQSGFYLHRPQTMQRRRRVDGHGSELLCACFMPAPFDWVVTAANDKTLCFWDGAFNLAKKWNLNSVVGTICWCPEVHALYAGDHFTEKIWPWKIDAALAVKASSSPMNPDKGLNLKTKHTKPVQAMLWLAPLQVLATASLDATIQLFDLVLMARTHVLTGHTKGVTCLEYAANYQMLLSSGFDNFIAIWDPSAGIMSHKLVGHECSIYQLCALPDSEHEFASVDCDGVVRVWDVAHLRCSQSYHASDRRAEEAGEIEPLEPMALCAVSRGRIVVSGRRLMVFDRDASDPAVTADWPINAIAFNHRRIEIITPILNKIYHWDALTGGLLLIHDDVCEGNITAISIAPGERRIFAGSDDGSIVCINGACGAKLKTLTSHTYEVTQIDVIPGKILTLSSPQKLINIHDDTDPQKAVILKQIDLSTAGVILRFSHDGREMIAGASQDGDIFWYNIDFAKQVSSSVQCEVKHDQAVSCVHYFLQTPLIVTADSEGHLIFWSVPPLRTYSFFSMAKLSLGGAEGGSVGITSLSISWPEEDRIFVGTERGGLACVNVSGIVLNAQQQRADILRRKDSGEAAEVISGRIFDSLPKPCNTPEHVFTLPNDWLVERAHRGSVEGIVSCRRRPFTILTLGLDSCVRVWDHATGELLGSLEQGLTGRHWQFPLDAHFQVEQDLESLQKAEDDDDEAGGDGKAPKPEEAVADAANAAGFKRRISRKATRRNTLMRMELKLYEERMAAQNSTLKLPPQELSEDWHRVGSRYLSSRWKGELSEDWLAGPLASAMDPVTASTALPPLQSGLRRPPASQRKKVIEAAKALSVALGSMQKSRSQDWSRRS